MPSLTSCPSLPVANGRAGPWFMRVEKLGLPLTNCGTVEQILLTGGEKGTGELALRL